VLLPFDMACSVSSPGALLMLKQNPGLADLVKDWDFSLGKSFQAEVLHRFSSSVHHPSSSPDGSFPIAGGVSALSLPLD
jgi:hypothetical protein